MDQTVHTLSPAALASYRETLRKRKQVKRPETERILKAREVARRAAGILKKQFGVEKVVLFGSVVHPSLFHAQSDVDLAVWNLTGRTYFRAVGILQSLDPDIKIDLVSFDQASPALQNVIQRDGEEL